MNEDYDFSFPEQLESPGKNSRSLLFSIFLVMLAFFIMLDSISLIDNKKKHDSMQSVNNKFSDSAFPLKIENKDHKENNPAENLTGDGTPLNYFGELKKIAREPVELIKGRVEMGENDLSIILPVDSFFIKDSPKIQEFELKLLKRIAEQTLRYQKIDIEFSLPSSGDNDNYDGNNLAVKRAGNFASEMQKFGIDESEIYTGVKPNNSNELTIEFLLRNGQDEQARKNNARE